MHSSAPCSGALGLLVLMLPVSAQIQQSEDVELYSSDPSMPPNVQYDSFGHAVDFDANAQRMIVGALPGDCVQFSGKFYCSQSAGEAHVFVRQPSGWVEEAKLVDPAGGPGWQFGYAVALSGDGSRAVIGEPGGYPMNTSGAVVVFRRNGSNWSKKQTILGTVGPIANFGARLSMSSDGTRLLVATTGGVHVYDLVSDQYQLTSTITLPSSIWDLELDGSGQRFVVGMALLDAVSVFDWDGSAWVETPIPPADPGWGYQVAIAASGDVLAVNILTPNDSTTYVYAWDGSAWSLEGSLDPNPLFRSYDVALSADGRRLALATAAPLQSGLLPRAVKVYERAAQGWLHVADLPHSDSEKSNSPNSWSNLLVPVFGDLGNWLAVGSPHDNDTGKSNGSVYVWELDGNTTPYCTPKINSLGCIPRIDVEGIAPSVSVPLAFDVLGTSVLNNKNGLLFYGLAGTAAIPFLGGTLCAQPPLRRTPLQNAGGTPPPSSNCSGSYTFDINAWAQSGADPALVAGASAYCQYWSRDPLHPDGTGTGLSSAMQVPMAP